MYSMLQRYVLNKMLDNNLDCLIVSSREYLVTIISREYLQLLSFKIPQMQVNRLFEYYIFSCENLVKLSIICHSYPKSTTIGLYEQKQ